MKGAPNTFSVIAIAAIGVLLAQMIKFTFTDLIPNLLSFQRHFRTNLRTYTYRLFLTVESLDRKLDILANLSAEDWTNSKKYPYLREESLYSFGAYLGWIYILEREALVNRFSRNYAVRVFNQYLYFPHSAISSDRDLGKVADFSQDEKRTSAIARPVLTALGEAMTTTDVKTGFYRPKTFLEFKNEVNHDPLKEWVRPVERFLTASLKAKRRQASASYNRFFLFRIHLRVLLQFLRSYQAADKTLDSLQLDDLHPELRKHLPSLYQKRPAWRLWLLRLTGRPGTVG